jgi:hypothetical protein
VYRIIDEQAQRSRVDPTATAHEFRAGIGRVASLRMIELGRGVLPVGARE